MLSESTHPSDFYHSFTSCELPTDLMDCSLGWLCHLLVTNTDNNHRNGPETEDSLLSLVGLLYSNGCCVCSTGLDQKY